MLLTLGVLATATAAMAQPAPGPLPPVVVDVRGFYTGLGQDPLTAAELGVAPTALPSRALGGAVGLNVYPIRRGSFAIGLGGEFVLARGRKVPDPDDPFAVQIAVEQRLQGLSGGFSLNFGQRDGWSYLSAGLGPMQFGTFLGDAAPAESAPRKSTINLGGGARWFTNRHLAVTFDVRFYLTRPELATASYPGRQRNRLLVLSGGVSIR